MAFPISGSVASWGIPHPDTGTMTSMHQSEDAVVSHSSTCSSDPFFRDVAVRKLTVVGRQGERNAKNRVRTSGRYTLEHIQSATQTGNYAKSYPKSPWSVFI